MGIMRHRSEHNRIFGCIRDEAGAYRNWHEVSDTSRQFCQNRSERECHGKGMNAARQRLRRLGRATGTRTRSAASDCIVRSVSFGRIGGK